MTLPGERLYGDPWAGGEEPGAMRHTQTNVGCRTQEMMPRFLHLQYDCFEGEWIGQFKSRVFSKRPGFSGPARTHLKPYLQLVSSLALYISLL